MRASPWLASLSLASIACLAFGPAAESCIQFKAPGGSVDSGQRDPEDAPAETNEPADDAPSGDSTGGEKSGPGGPTTPPPKAPPPTTGGGPSSLGGGTGGKAPAVDNSTWETWWELNRVEFFPKRWVKRVLTPDENGLVRAGPQALHPKRVAEMWPVLVKLADHKHVFVAESALITLGRSAANEEQRADARRILEGKLRDRRREVARAASLGLFYVADDTSVLPMYEVASDKKADEQVRAFVALTLTNLKHPMSAGLLQELADTKDGYYELVAAALMGLGYSAAESKDPAIPALLENVAFKQKNIRSEYRALAVESFGRMGCFETGREPLLKALADRDTNVRRSAAMAIGVLDYRTEAERRIAEIKAPYEQYEGLQLKDEDKARVAELQGQIEAQRLSMAANVKAVMKTLGETARNDNDVFTQRMCVISLGRIYSQNPHSLALRYIRGALEKDRIGMREYCILALAIARADDAAEVALKYVEERNPSTRGAACIAMGLIANADVVEGYSAEVRAAANKKLRDVIKNDRHPVIRGYAALAAGIAGDPASGKDILALVRDTSSPTPRAYGALGMALLGTQEGAADIVNFVRGDQMRNGFVASHMVYALGLTKDRSEATFKSLLEKSQDAGDQYVQAATLAAIGYLSSGEFYPKRHLMSRGYNYMLNLSYIDTYFYKL